MAECEWILLGAGHTHLHILEMWRRNPVQNVRLTCISNQCLASYSGMLPGVLAGDYRSEEMNVDLARRCAAVGARLILGETIGLNRTKKQIILAGRAPLKYDQLSIGIGSVPASLTGSHDALSLKPMQTFLQRLEDRVEQSCGKGAATKRVVIVGGGAGGVEIALCLPAWFKTHYSARTLDLTVVHRAARFNESSSPSTSQAIETIFEQRGVQLRLNSTAVEINSDGVVVEDAAGGRELFSADVVISAVAAVGPPLLDGLDLANDSRGFLVTDRNLRSIDDPAIFVVGDSGSCAAAPNPKAGVYAVRQGPVLWENLRRAHLGRTLVPWKPQETFLSLLNTGDGRAVLAYHGFTFVGRWCWKLKDKIDRRFMAKHQRY